jgi:hypothetical protein
MKKLFLLATLATLPMTTMAGTDPDGKQLYGFAKERLAVERCGVTTNVVSIESATQGYDTFNVSLLTVTATSVARFNLEGSYTYTDGTTYMVLNNVSRSALVDYVQALVGTVCGQQLTVDPRSMTVTRNQLDGDAGVLRVEGEYKNAAGNVGSVKYSLRSTVFYK